jgi:hypothetical protein
MWWFGEKEKKLQRRLANGSGRGKASKESWALPGEEKMAIFRLTLSGLSGKT